MLSNRLDSIQASISEIYERIFNDEILTTLCLSEFSKNEIPIRVKEIFQEVICTQREAYIEVLVQELNFLQAENGDLMKKLEQTQSNSEEIHKKFEENLLKLEDLQKENFKKNGLLQEKEKELRELEEEIMRNNNETTRLASENARIQGICSAKMYASEEKDRIYERLEEENENLKKEKILLEKEKQELLENFMRQSQETASLKLMLDESNKKKELSAIKMSKKQEEIENLKSQHKKDLEDSKEMIFSEIKAEIIEKDERIRVLGEAYDSMIQRDDAIFKDFHKKNKILKSNLQELKINYEALENEMAQQKEFYDQKIAEIQTFNGKALDEITKKAEEMQNFYQNQGISALETEKAKSSMEKSLAEAEINNIKNKYNELLEKLAEKKNEIDGFLKDISSLKDEKSKICLEKNHLIQENQRFSFEIKKISEENERLVLENTLFLECNKEFEKKLFDLKQNFDEKNEKKKEFENIIENLNSEIKLLKEKLNKFSFENLDNYNEKKSFNNENLKKNNKDLDELNKEKKLFLKEKEEFIREKEAILADLNEKQTILNEKIQENEKNNNLIIEKTHLIEKKEEIYNENQELINAKHQENQILLKENNELMQKYLILSNEFIKYKNKLIKWDRFSELSEMKTIIFDIKKKISEEKHNFSVYLAEMLFQISPFVLESVINEKKKCEELQCFYEEKISSLQNELNSIKTQNEEIYASLEEERKHFLQEKESFCEKLNTLNEEKQFLIEKNKLMEKTKDELLASCEAFKMKLEALEKDNEQFIEVNLVLKKEKEILLQENKKLEFENNSFLIDIENFHREIDSILKTHQDLLKDKTALFQENTILKSKIKELEQVATLKQEKIKFLEKFLQKIKDSVFQSLVLEFNRQKKNLSSYKQNFTELSAQFISLKNQQNLVFSDILEDLNRINSAILEEKVAFLKEKETFELEKNEKNEEILEMKNKMENKNLEIENFKRKLLEINQKEKEYVNPKFKNEEIFEFKRKNQLLDSFLQEKTQENEFLKKENKELQLKNDEIQFELKLKAASYERLRDEMFQESKKIQENILFFNKKKT